MTDEPRSVLPAFTLLHCDDGSVKPWGVTINDYGPGADDVSTIVNFETEAEALAFIAEFAPKQKQ